jgi:hypothetical protein
MYSSQFGTSKSCRSFQLHAPVTGTLEVRITAEQYMTALFADEPGGSLYHWPELIEKKAIWAANHLLSHFPSAATQGQSRPLSSHFTSTDSKINRIAF